MRRRALLMLFAASAVLVGIAAAFSSSAPDGLERVARDHGIDAANAESAALGSPVADYAAGAGPWATAAAGGVGLLLTLAVAMLLFGWLTRRTESAGAR